jgi:WD40 repeat protein
LQSVKFSPRGRYVASGAGTWGYAGRVKDFTRVWDLSLGEPKCVAKFTCPARVFAMAFSPDEKMLAVTGRRINEVVLWDIRTETQVSSFKVATPWIYSVLFADDGKTLIGGSMSGQIKFWRIPTGAELGTLSLDDKVTHLAFFPGNEDTLISVGDIVRLWRLMPREEISVPRATPDYR